MSHGTTVKWYVHDADDCRVSMVSSYSDDAKSAVKELAEAWWPRHGDYCTEFSVTIVEPAQWAGKYPVEVESMPYFVVGKGQ